MGLLRSAGAETMDAMGLARQGAACPPWALWALAAALAIDSTDAWLRLPEESR